VICIKDEMLEGCRSMFPSAHTHAEQSRQGSQWVLGCFSVKSRDAHRVQMSINQSNQTLRTRRPDFDADATRLLTHWIIATFETLVRSIQESSIPHFRVSLFVSALDSQIQTHYSDFCIDIVNTIKFGIGIMARGIEGNEIATPRSSANKAKPATASKNAKQQSIAGFFTKRATVASSPATQSVTSVAEKAAASSPIVATQAKRQSSALAVSRNKENSLCIVPGCE
jgi:hypothetical protein